MAKRVAESNAWQGSGQRSAAIFIAGQTGTSVGRAQAGLDLADQLVDLTDTDEAFRNW